jgi:hypothetical protein
MSMIEEPKEEEQDDYSEVEPTDDRYDVEREITKWEPNE